MNVLLIFPPSPFLEDARSNPPLGILYLAAAVEKYCGGVQVDVLDLGGDDNFLNTVSAKLRTKQYDIVGISVCTVHYQTATSIATLVKCESKALVVTGGPHITALPKSILSDVAVVGEGEETFVHIVKSVEEGIIYEPGTVLRNRNYIVQPDWYPARHLVDMHSYKLNINGIPATPIMTSRGCPSRCCFCMQGIWKKFRMFSPAYVRLELRQIRDMGFEAVLFIDDTFTYDGVRLKEICKSVKHYGFKAWRCWTRVDRVDEDMFPMMKDAGCVHVAFGIESGSQHMLNVMGKGTTVEQNTHAIKLAQKAGLDVRAFFMIGFPGETKESIETTMKYIQDMHLTDVTLFVFSPTVGCDTWMYPEKYGVKNFNRNDFENQWRIGKDAMGSLYLDTEYMTGEELKAIHIDCLKQLGKV